MSDNKSLNRGLDALLGDQKLPTTTKEIDLEKITAGRYQPRQEFDEVKSKAKAITPVPGGVGPMTIACLLSNTLDCFKAR